MPEIVINTVNYGAEIQIIQDVSYILTFVTVITVYDYNSGHFLWGGVCCSVTNSLEKLSGRMNARVSHALRSTGVPVVQFGEATDDFKKCISNILCSKNSWLANEIGTFRCACMTACVSLFRLAGAQNRASLEGRAAVCDKRLLLWWFQNTLQITVPTLNFTDRNHTRSVVEYSPHL